MGSVALGAQRNRSKVGRYQLLSVLGQGGMADVHLARMRGPAGFDKLVVIKQICQRLADDPEVLRMFLDEARIAARLSHPNVVQTYEVGEDGERYFLAMEYLDGQPLSSVRSRLQAEGGLPLAMHLRVLIDVLAGLHHAHELPDYDGTPLGVVHRDATPQNIFVTYAGAVKVVDFGIAKARCSVVETRAGLFKGKIPYLAREQALGERVDRRADVFAVGVMLWEAVTGQRPWAGLDGHGIVKRLVAGRFPAVRDACPGVSEELEAILHKALAPARDDRYATAADFQAALEAHLERSGDHTHLRDLGALLQQRFSAERAGVQALVERRMRADPDETSVKRTIPTKDVAQVEERCTIPEPAIVRSRTATSYPDTPRPGSLSAIEEGSLVDRPAPPPRRRRRMLVSLAPLVFALLMAGVVRSLPARSPRASAASATAALIVSAPAAPKGPEVELLVTATPGTATIYLDGAPIGQSPSRTTVPRDGTAHEIRVEAPRFVSGVEQVVFDRDRTVSLVLGAEPASAPPPSARPPPARPPSKGRSVEERNPYLPAEPRRSPP